MFNEVAVSALTLRVTFNDEQKWALSAPDLNKFKQLLEAHIFKNKGEPMVRIEACDLYDGSAVIRCFDEPTFEWLSAQVGTLSEGAYKGWKRGEFPLRVKPPTRKMWCWLAGEAPINTRQFFLNLGSQNSLNTSQWRLNAAIQGRGGRTLLLEVDEESLEAMKSLDFKPFYGIGRLHLQDRAVHEKKVV